MKARSLWFAAALAVATSAGSVFVAVDARAQAAHEAPPQPPVRRGNDPMAVPPPAGDPHAVPPRAGQPNAPPMRNPGAGNPHVLGGQPGQRAPGPTGPAGHAPAAHGAGHGDSAHGDSAHGDSGHGEHGAHDPNAPPPPINWWHGLLGEKAGEPPPFLASLINFGVLVLIVNRYGRKALAESLVKRKENITREIDEATRLRKAAEKRLEEYEAKLEKINDELERVRREFREQGERDKARIIEEAKERRERMRKDTEVVLVQEAKQMRQELLAEVVVQATRVATEILSKNTTLGDHDRFAESFLNQLRSNAKFSVAPPARGGSAYPGPAAAKGNS